VPTRLVGPKEAVAVQVKKSNKKKKEWNCSEDIKHTRLILHNSEG
jgi:hypothetical protein